MQRDDSRREAIGLSSSLRCDAMRVSSAGVLELEYLDDEPAAMVLEVDEFVLVTVLEGGELLVRVGPVEEVDE